MGINLQDVKRGDILFTRDNSLLSRAIRLVTTGKPGQNVPSHCGVVSNIYQDNGEWVVDTIEAMWTGVGFYRLNRYFKKNTVVWIARMKEPRNIDFGLRWYELQVGKNYDFGALFGIFIRALLRYLKAGKKFKNILDSKTRFFCSEVNEYYSMHTGKRLWKGEPSLVTPYDQFRSKQLTFVAHHSYKKKKNKVQKVLQLINL